METAKYSVPSINCGHCTKTIEMELSEIEGVSRVRADVDSKSVEVDFNVPATEEMVVTALKEINFPPEVEK
ncbi:MAG: heavy-metal-associated domain-containing protein [Pelolinea sp.]|nr:heavy-metal-associated domain-containing protein [Pelolinea sp.]